MNISENRDFQLFPDVAQYFKTCLIANSGERIDFGTIGLLVRGFKNIRDI